MASKGSAEWNGDLKGGKGHFKAGDTIEGAFSFKSRFEDDESGANPEQLIAAAHTACFSMALSNELAEAGHTPESIKTDATVQLRVLDDGPTITKIALTLVGRVPGISEDEFKEYAEGAKKNCPVSKALASVPEITLDITLDD